MCESMTNCANSALPLTSAKGGSATGREAASFQVDLTIPTPRFFSKALRKGRTAGRCHLPAESSVYEDGMRAELTDLDSATLLMTQSVDEDDEMRGSNASNRARSLANRESGDSNPEP